MKRTRKRSEDRRKELIKATLNSIGEASSLDVTVGEIAQRAGVSSALAHHYFGGKDDLFLAAMRYLLAAFRRDLIDKIQYAEGPRARLSAIVSANFSEDQFDATTVAAWTIFYSKAQSSPRYARLLQIYIRRLRSNLIHELKELMPMPRAEKAAEAVGAMIDGLYLRQGLQPAAADRARCVAMTESLIDSFMVAER